MYFYATYSHIIHQLKINTFERDNCIHVQLLGFVCPILAANI